MSTFVRFGHHGGFDQFDVWTGSGWTAACVPGFNWRDHDVRIQDGPAAHVFQGDDIVIRIGTTILVDHVEVYAGRVPASALRDTAGIAMGLVGNEPFRFSACVEGGLSIRDLGADPVREFVSSGILPETVFSQADAHLARLAEVLEQLRSLPCGERLLVFGSAASGVKEVPGDIDVFLDAVGMERTLVSDATVRLLRLARANYGLIDPFVKTSKSFFCRSDEATSWVVARNGPAILADALQGIPIGDVELPTRPYADLRELPSSGPSSAAAPAP